MTNKNILITTMAVLLTAFTCWMIKHHPLGFVFSFSVLYFITIIWIDTYNAIQYFNGEQYPEFETIESTNDK
mgnify:CR=1 FL=1